MVAVLALVFATAGAAIGASIHLPNIITPHSEGQITNLDVLRLEIKNYYGTPGATTGSALGAGWTLPLNPDSYYAQEAEKVAAGGWHWLKAGANVHKPMKAIVLDVDDTALATWNYELYSNWDYNPTTNATFVNGQYFPATPGMVDMVWDAYNAGYAIFWITGRPGSQEQATLGNLTDDVTAELPNGDPRDVDAGYPAPTDVALGVDGLFTKPLVGSYPAYLDKPEFCADAIAASKSCPTIQYKSGTRAYIESLGWDIVATFGDQYSDLLGGYADNTFKMPNPNYYLP
jgi:Predicted secreted acid phosphatase